MKLVVSGKGGVGKTTFSGTLANILADKDYRVLAVDSDPSMNLHSSIGVENPVPITVLKELIKDRAVMESGVFRLNPRVDDIPEKYSSKKKNLSLITIGTIETGGTGCICPETAFIKALLRHLVLKKGEYLVLDTEAGVEHLGRSIAEKFDLMFIVCEPSDKAVDTANRVYGLAKDIGIKKVLGVANKISSAEQESFISNALDFELVGSIPYDARVIEADMTRRTLYSLGGSQALDSIKRIVKDALDV